MQRVVSWMEPDAGTGKWECVFERAWLQLGWLFQYYVLNSKFILVQVPTFDSAHWWQVYIAAILLNQAVSTRTLYATRSHYHNTDLTNPYIILLILSTKLGTENYQISKLLGWLEQESNARSSVLEAFTVEIQRKREAHLIRPVIRSNSLK